MATLIADQLTLERSGRIIRAGISFAVGAGEAMQVRGPNGAGKTTLLRTIAGFLAQAHGSIRLEGTAEPGAPVSEHCHYVGHLNGAKAALTVAENVRFWTEILRAPGPAAASGVQQAHNLESAIARVGLTPATDIQAAYLSAGQKRRLALARLLVVPRLTWLLDEPATSLDQAGQELLATIAREHLAAGNIIVAATHAPLGFAAARTLDLSPAGAAAA